MMRRLHLFTYDIGDASRRRKVRGILLAFRVGGQKSVHECWVTPTELSGLRELLAGIIEVQEDRLHVFALDARRLPRLFGVARNFVPGYFSIL